MLNEALVAYQPNWPVRPGVGWSDRARPIGNRVIWIGNVGVKCVRLGGGIERQLPVGSEIEFFLADTLFGWPFFLAPPNIAACLEGDCFRLLQRFVMEPMSKPRREDLCSIVARCIAAPVNIAKFPARFVHPSAVVPWSGDKKIELIFDCHNYSE